jgi:hypothetical protein
VDNTVLASQFWQLIEARYPWVAHSVAERPLGALPEWSEEAFSREEQAWLACAEAAERASAPTAARWGRFARHAVRRLRGGVWRAADAPLRAVRAWLAANERRLPDDRVPDRLATMIEGLPRFLETAGAVVGGDAWTVRRVEALAADLTGVLVAAAEPSPTLQRALDALTAYAARGAFGIGDPHTVAWIIRAPDPECFARREARVLGALPSPAPLTADAVRRLLETLGLPGVDDVEPERRLARSLEAAWMAYGWPQLDFALADVAALPAVLDWVVARAAQMPGSDQAGWRWLYVRRQAVIFADARLWLADEPPERVAAWLAQFLTPPEAVAWVNWLMAEPGWALARAAWADLSGWSALGLDRLSDVLSRSPADSPPYWQWEPEQEDVLKTRIPS